MLLREIGSARSQSYGLRFGDEGRKEKEAIRDVFVAVRQVFADEGIMESQLVSQDHCLTILSEGFAPRATMRMQRHSKVTEPHFKDLQPGQVFGAACAEPVK